MGKFKVINYLLITKKKYSAVTELAKKNYKLLNNF